MLDFPKDCGPCGWPKAGNPSVDACVGCPKLGVIDFLKVGVSLGWPKVGALLPNFGAPEDVWSVFPNNGDSRDSPENNPPKLDASSPPKLESVFVMLLSASVLPTENKPALSFLGLASLLLVPPENEKEPVNDNSANVSPPELVGGVSADKLENMSTGLVVGAKGNEGCKCTKYLGKQLAASNTTISW